MSTSTRPVFLCQQDILKANMSSHKSSDAESIPSSTSDDESSVASSTVSSVAVAATALLATKMSKPSSKARILYICIGIIAASGYIYLVYHMYTRVRVLEDRVNMTLRERSIHNDTQPDIADTPPEPPHIPTTIEEVPDVVFEIIPDVAAPPKPKTRAKKSQSSMSPNLSLSSSSSASSEDSKDVSGGAAGDGE